MEELPKRHRWDVVPLVVPPRGTTEMSIDETERGDRPQSMYRTDEWEDSFERTKIRDEDPEYEQNDRVIELIEEFFR